MTVTCEHVSVKEETTEASLPDPSVSFEFPIKGQAAVLNRELAGSRHADRGTDREISRQMERPGRPCVALGVTDPEMGDG